MLQGFPVRAKSRSAEGGSPLPEREGSSPFPFLPAAAGGKRENWKALSSAHENLTASQKRATIAARQQYTFEYIVEHGGVEAPVGLTVFKTVGGLFSIVFGRFDPDTPLP